MIKERKEVVVLVKEYIEQQKKLAEEKIEKKQEEMKQIQETEKIISSKIEKIKQSDMDFEIFSPRTGEISLRERVKILEKELGQIRIQKVSLQETIDNLLEEKGNFEKMLEEIEEMFHVKHFL